MDICMHICNGFVINKMIWLPDREGAREGKGRRGGGVNRVINELISHLQPNRHDL
jgi:hypothetical protein